MKMLVAGLEFPSSLDVFCGLCGRFVTMSVVGSRPAQIDSNLIVIVISGCAIRVSQKTAYTAINAYLIHLHPYIDGEQIQAHKHYS